MYSDVEREARKLAEGVMFLAAFALTIPAANWLIGNAGTVCTRRGLASFRSRRASWRPPAS